MKKIRILAFVLCALLLFQAGTVPSFAAEADSAAATAETISKNGAPVQVDSDSVSIVNGCRTIEGMVPLGGSERRLQTAQSAFVFERNTKTVIYSYNPDMKLSPGTLAKLVTAAVVIEECDLDEKVTCNSKNISRLPAQTQNINLKDGEILTVEELLHYLIVYGANDAAVALTEHVSGNMNSFVVLMNAWVQNIGCTSTEFVNVHGLDKEGQFTTARDMARIYMACYDNTVLRDIMMTTKFDGPATNRSDERSVPTLNYLIDEYTVAKYYDNRVTGGMASATNGSGASLVCSAETDNLNLVLVILGSNREFAENGWSVLYYGNFDEMVELLEFSLNNYKACRLMYEGQALYQLPVTGGECHVVLQPKVNYDSALPADCRMENLIKDVKYNPISVPIKKGECLGTITLSYRSCVVAEADLYAMSDVNPGEGTSALGQENQKETSTFVKVISTICLGILGIVVIYLAVNALRRAYGQARRRRRRAHRRRSW